MRHGAHQGTLSRPPRGVGSPGDDRHGLPAAPRQIHAPSGASVWLEMEASLLLRLLAGRACQRSSCREHPPRAALPLPFPWDARCSSEKRGAPLHAAVIACSLDEIASPTGCELVPPAPLYTQTVPPVSLANEQISKDHYFDFSFRPMHLPPITPPAKRVRGRICCWTIRSGPPARPKATHQANPIRALRDRCWRWLGEQASRGRGRCSCCPVREMMRCLLSNPAPGRMMKHTPPTCSTHVQPLLAS